MQLLVTTTAICALVEILRESMVSSCLSMCCSFSKIKSRSQTFMLRSMEEVMTQFSLPVTAT